MAVRSVTVRYTASVGALVSELNRAAKANDQLARSSENAGRGLDKMATTGAAIGFGLGVAVSKFAEFDAAMSRAQAGSGATGSELNALRDAALEAGQATQYSATQAADAITELAKAGVSTTNILNGGLNGALNLAAAGQLEVAEAAEIAATAMNQFSLEGDQVNHVADLLAAGAGKAQGSVSDMGAALKQAGLVAAGMDLSIEETTAGLTAFAAEGLIGSDAGTSFKSMLQRLTPQSKEAASLMKDLGINAFTAGGSFKGLEAFAGNLQESLADLTPEQRNAALATIFGSDAVRAANVLYEQGAEGIHEYTEAVNDQGFAQRQARTLTDNLIGDLERLGGAFDTNLIRDGSGANDTLRTLVQSGESLLDVIGQIPGPVVTGAAAFGALTLLGPKVGNVAKVIGGPLVSSLTRFREEAALQRALAPQVGAGMDDMGTRAERGATRFQRAAGNVTAASKAMRGAAGGVLSILGGPWGAALTAATIGVTAFATAQQNAQAAGQEFADTLDQQTGTLTEASRAFVGKKLLGDLSAEDIRALEDYGVSVQQAGQAALEGGPKMAAFRARLDEMAASGQGPTAALNGLSSAVENTNEDVERGKAIWQAYVGIVSGSASSAAAADRAQSDLRGTTDDYTSSAKTAATNTGDMGGALDAMATDATDAKGALDALKDSVDILGGGASALQAAQDKVAKSTRDLTTAGKQEEGGTKTKTELQEEYRESLRQVGEDTRTLLQAQIDQNASVGTLKNTYDTQREAVEKSLEAHGFHGAKLDEEAEKILGTRDDFNLLLLEYAKNPETIATTITTPGLETSKTKVEGYWTVINGVPTFVQTNFAANTYDASVRVKGLADAIAAIHDKTITITAIYQRFGFQASLEAQQARHHPDVFFGATGGPVLGPGTSTSDSILARLSNNEHVLPADEVDMAGGHDAIYRMRKAIRTGDLRFRHGGAVDLLSSRGSAAARRRESMRGGVPGYRYGGVVDGGSWTGAGMDYARLTKSVVAAAAAMKTPQFHFVSGEDAKVAAAVGVREFYYRRDHT